MKKEELKKLEAKYLAGETTLAEERLLREYSEDGYFSLLSDEHVDKMPLDFESFLAKTEDVESESVSVSQNRKIWRLFSSIAAAVLVICLGIWYLPNQKALEIEEEVVRVKQPLNEAPERVQVDENLLGKHKESLKQLSRNSTVITMETYKSKKSVLTNELKPKNALSTSEEFYVEVNGVKITSEEEALKITEKALLLASSNLKKGIKEVENIKSLSIEL